MMNFAEFHAAVTKLKKIYSGSVYYRVINTDQEFVYYQRLNAQNPDYVEKINLQKLFYYYKGGVYNSKEPINYGLKGKQSPSTAIINSIVNGEQNTCPLRNILSRVKTIFTKKEDCAKTNIEVYDSNFMALMNPESFRSMSSTNVKDIPSSPGLYAIRIKSIDTLPLAYANELSNRGHNLLYIGISKFNLQERLWEEELHHRKAATFFRSMGTVLGFVPIKGSLKSGGNYKFSNEDTAKIIEWMNDNLLINYISLDKNIAKIEKQLITKLNPIINIKDNPHKFKLLEEQRAICRRIALGIE